MSARARSIVPKKVFESWFAVHAGGAKVGHGHLFWEPHADRTAWFQQEWSYVGPGGPTDVRFEARFALREWPALEWCRRREGGKTAEFAPAGAAKRSPGARALPETKDLLPDALVPVVAASLPSAPGEALRYSTLLEAEGEIAHGRILFSHGPDEIEIGAERFATARFTAAREGEPPDATLWIDANRRIRKIDLHRAGVVALLSTRAAAEGAAP